MNKIVFNVGTLLLFCLMFSGCFSTHKDNQERGFYLVNLLDKNIFNDCHIKGSINIELQDLEKFALGLPKTTEIVVYCSNYLCTTSEIAAKKLKSMGFENIWAYEAGIAEWYQKGLPVEGSCTMKYLTMKVKKGPEPIDEIKVITTEKLHQKLKENAS